MPICMEGIPSDRDGAAAVVHASEGSTGWPAAQTVCECLCLNPSTLQFRMVTHLQQRQRLQLCRVAAACTPSSRRPTPPGSKRRTARATPSATCSYTEAQTKTGPGLPALESGLVILLLAGLPGQQRLVAVDTEKWALRQTQTDSGRRYAALGRARLQPNVRDVKALPCLVAWGAPRRRPRGPAERPGVHARACQRLFKNAHTSNALRKSLGKPNQRAWMQP